MWVFFVSRLKAVKAVLATLRSKLDAIVAGITEVNTSILSFVVKIDEIITLLKDIREVLFLISLKTFPPGPMGYQIVGEKPGEGEEMADIIVYDVNLPALDVPNDVVSRELTVVTGGETTVITVGPTDTVVPGLEAEQDAPVDLTLVNVDDSGNRSGPSLFSFVAVDTIAPPVPGNLGVVIVDEIVDPSPAV